MHQIKQYTIDLFSAILAGIMIGIGGTVYLSVNNQVIGSLLFALGLFTILVYQFNLFTGKIGYLFNNKPKYLIQLLVIWMGNLIGTIAYGYVLHIARPELAVKTATMCTSKLNQPMVTTLILGVFCGLLMFVAVDNFKTNVSSLGKYLGIFLCVSIFILCKDEHCVADMFYFSLNQSIFSLQALKYILIVTVGNAIGSWLIPIFKKINEKFTNSNK